MIISHTLTPLVVQVTERIASWPWDPQPGMSRDPQPGGLSEWDPMAVVVARVG
jgi:hypothetical protein